MVLHIGMGKMKGQDKVFDILLLFVCWMISIVSVCVIGYLFDCFLVAYILCLIVGWCVARSVERIVGK